MECQTNPVAQHSAGELDHRAADRNPRDAALAIERDGQRHLHRWVSDGERIIGTRDRRVDAAVADFDRLSDAALLEPRTGWPRREQEKRALRTEQVRDRHRA